jgi:hypothetical protein
MARWLSSASGEQYPMWSAGPRIFMPPWCLPMGLCQGGAIAFLTSSYLHYLQDRGELPADIVFKTYCSAAPKPGNLFYAYDFDFITRNGWGFNVVNSADWVPESAFSVQTLSDFNNTNPFIHMDGMLKKQPWLVRWYLKGKYNKLKKSTRKAQRCFRDVLGHMMYKKVKKVLPQFKEPVYAEGNKESVPASYVRTLLLDDAAVLWSGRQVSIYLGRKIHIRLLNFSVTGFGRGPQFLAGSLEK